MVLLRESAFRVLVPVTYASALGVLGALDLIPTVLNLIRMAPYVVEGRLVAFYYYRNQTGIPSNSSSLKRPQPPPHILPSAAVAQSWLFATPWTVARQAPLSMEILQARILEWVALPSFRGSSRPRDRTQVSQIAGGFFTSWATREASQAQYGASYLY